MAKTSNNYSISSLEQSPKKNHSLNLPRTFLNSQSCQFHCRVSDWLSDESMSLITFSKLSKSPRPVSITLSFDWYERNQLIDVFIDCWINQYLNASARIIIHMPLPWDIDIPVRFWKTNKSMSFTVEGSKSWAVDYLWRGWNCQAVIGEWTGISVSGTLCTSAEHWRMEMQLVFRLSGLYVC